MKLQLLFIPDRWEHALYLTKFNDYDKSCLSASSSAVPVLTTESIPSQLIPTKPCCSHCQSLSEERNSSKGSLWKLQWHV